MRRRALAPAELLARSLPRIAHGVLLLAAQLGALLEPARPDQPLPPPTVPGRSRDAARRLQRFRGAREARPVPRTPAAGDVQTAGAKSAPSPIGPRARGYGFVTRATILGLFLFLFRFYVIFYLAGSRSCSQVVWCVLDLVCNSCAWTNNKNTARRHTLCMTCSRTGDVRNTHTQKRECFRRGHGTTVNQRARARVRAFFCGAAQHAGTPGRPREPHTKFSLCVPARSADDRDHMHLR